MVIEGGDIYVARGETREKWFYRFGGANERGRWRDVRGLFGTLGLRNTAFGHRGSDRCGVVGVALGLVWSLGVRFRGGRWGWRHGVIDVDSNVTKKYFCDKVENTWVDSRVVGVKAQE